MITHHTSTKRTGTGATSTDTRRTDTRRTDARRTDIRRTDARRTGPGRTGTDTRRTSTTVRSLAVAAVCVGGALAVPSAALARVAHGPAQSTLEVLCGARGGSFHVNTYDGVNLICSTPRHLGDFQAERAACDRLGGDFSRTVVRDRRASWFCHHTAH